MNDYCIFQFGFYLKIGRYYSLGYELVIVHPPIGLLRLDSTRNHVNTKYMNN